MLDIKALFRSDVSKGVFVFLQLFYMLKGDMVLKIVEQGKHRDIPIMEGEVCNSLCLALVFSSADTEFVL